MYPFNLLLGSFHVSNYELFHFMGLSLLVALEFILLDKDAFVKRWQVLIACTIGIATGTSGAKLTHLLLYAEQYRGIPPGQVFLTAGHAYIGGAVLALVAIYILFRYYKVSFLYAGDYTVPFFGLFRAFGRIGCLLTGCCHGSPSNLPWVLYFGDNILRHPTQAYMIILTFSIFAAGRMNYRRMRDKATGMIFFSSVIMYAAGRFIVEFFRVDSPYVFGALKVSHIVLAVLTVYGISGLFVLYRRYTNKAEIVMLLRRLFFSFFLTAIFFGALILTVLSFIPKVNHAHQIDLKVTKAGLATVEHEKTPDYERVQKIIQAIEAYRRDNGEYPTQEQGLHALIEKPAVEPIPFNWHGPYANREIFISENKKPYGYNIYRYGDTWSYRILIPEHRISPVVKEEALKEYVLEVELHHGLALYKSDNGRYPTQRQGLEALLREPGIPPVPEKWNGPYVKGELRDEKGKRYFYRIETIGGEEIYSIYTD
jgi:phosphatidylglycerol---prolipoprotein diacylglyceryl transferase